MADKEDIVVDGEVLDLDDFTFREMRELRRVVKEHIIESEDDVDIEDLSLSEYLPAAIYLLKRRSDPEYTIDKALDLKFKDVVKPHVNGNGSRPTQAAKPAAKKKPSARG